MNFDGFDLLGIFVALLIVAWIWRFFGPQR